MGWGKNPFLKKRGGEIKDKEGGKRKKGRERKKRVEKEAKGKSKKN